MNTVWNIFVAPCALFMPEEVNFDQANPCSPDAAYGGFDFIISPFFVA